MKRRVIVEDFGKIKHAELEMKPMMMFVGDNNSGKSYLMSLLWGLLSDTSEILTHLTDEVRNSKLYEECERYVRELIGGGEEIRSFSQEWVGRFWRLLNCCIEQNKDQFVSDIFNKDMYIGKLELVIEGLADLKIETRIEYGEDRRNRWEKEDVEHEYIKMICIWIDSGYWIGIRIVDDYMTQTGRYVEFILRVFLRLWISGSKRVQRIGQNNTVFLPSSRTGFVLSKNLLINNIYENSFNRFSNVIQEDIREEQDSYFTKPVISFLKLLNNIGDRESGRQKLEQLADFIEQTILHGKVEIQNAISKSFMYKPETLNEPIQMYLASAIVTEITPLYLLCKYRYGMSQMFIEEPEMCMHPKLQVMVARVLVRLCNMGISVTMTTHSDIMIQHINNMLRVKNSHKKQELMAKYKIEEQDLLGTEEVGVYQFSCQGNDSSQVVELKAGEMGFETTTFSDAFEEMLELTYDI